MGELAMQLQEGIDQRCNVNPAGVEQIMVRGELEERRPWSRFNQ
jgi:hypothetical protein